MKVLDRCGSVYRDVQATNNGYSGGAVTESAQSDSDLVVASCEDKQEKNSLTCIVTASGNDTSTVKLDIKFSASQKKGKVSSPKKEQQKVPQESSSSLTDRICNSGALPSTLIFDIKPASQAAECPTMCGLLFSCE